MGEIFARERTRNANQRRLRGTSNRSASFTADSHQRAPAGPKRDRSPRGGFPPLVQLILDLWWDQGHFLAFKVFSSGPSVSIFLIALSLSRSARARA